MNLTDNALRKLQQEGLFAIGPSQQSPPDTAETTPLDEADSAVELEAQQEKPQESAPTSASDPAMATEPFESVRLTRTGPVQTPETESTEASESTAPAPIDETPGHEPTAYDPVIPSFSGPPLTEDGDQTSTKPQPENTEATRYEPLGIPEQPTEGMDVAEWLEDRESVGEPPMAIS